MYSQLPPVTCAVGAVSGTQRSGELLPALLARRVMLEIPASVPAADEIVRYRWRILVSALLVQITISVVTLGFPALAPFAMPDLHLSTAEVGLFATTLNLGTMIALLPAGWAVDVLGERRVLVAGGIATGLVSGVASFVPHLALLLPVLIVVGLAAATPTPAGSTAIISAFALRDRGFVMSLRQTGVPAGGAVAALVLPPIAIAYGWRHALLVAAATAVVGAVVAWALVRRVPPRRNATVRGPRGSMREVASRDTTLIGLASMFLTSGQFILTTYIALYLLNAFHLRLAVGSLFLVATNLGGVVGRLLWGAVSDRGTGQRRKRTLIMVSLIAAAAFLVLAWLPGATPIALLLVLTLAIGATVIGWNGVYVTLLSEIAPSDKRGRAVAYGLTMAQIGIFAGPFLFGLLVEVSHSYRLALSVVAVTMLIPSILLRAVHEKPLVPQSTIRAGTAVVGAVREFPARSRPDRLPRRSGAAAVLVNGHHNVRRNTMAELQQESVVRSAVTIRRIEVLPLRSRLTFHRTLSKGSVSSGNDADWVGDPVLIRLESSDGFVGTSQVRPPTPWLGETTESIVSAVRRYYGPALLGANVAERELTMLRLERILPGNTVALAGLDIAIHDLVARTYGIPIYALLGGAQVKVPLDWSVSLNAQPKIVAEATRAVHEFGLQAICLKVGPSERWREDIAVFKQVRAEVGSDVAIGMDPNEGYDLPTMLRVLRGLQDADVAYIEQPLPRNDLDGLRMLRAQGGAPVFVDEGAISLADAFRAISSASCDVLVLKLWKSGGFTNARKMAVVAEASGVGTTLGGVAQGSVLEAAACAHLYASLGVPPMAAEFALGLNVVDDDPIVALPDDFAIKNGTAEVPGGPGLGVEVDMGTAREIALASFTIE
jgi:L-alanine-DL-glutamate epimerase-like enolase superfamily enzyme/MFS family permease